MKFRWKQGLFIKYREFLENKIYYRVYYNYEAFYS